MLALIPGARFRVPERCTTWESALNRARTSVLETVCLHDEISLSLAELHLLLERGADGIQRVSSWNDLHSRGVRETCRCPGPQGEHFESGGERKTQMLTWSDEKIPSHLKPAKMCSLCSLSLKAVLAAMAAMRSFSSEEGAARSFCVASFQGLGSLQ